MGIWNRIAAQFGRPEGILGGIAGRIMASRKSNIERIDWAVGILGPGPDSRVLETGFGPGVAIERMSGTVPRGFICGIDHSGVMVRQATKRNRTAVESGRVRLVLGPVSDMPDFDEPFDRVLDINSFQFWEDPVRDLCRIRRVMTKGGLIALVHQPRKPGATDEDAAAAGMEFSRMLEEAGFRDVGVHFRNMKPVSAVCVTGKN
ncbi:MAG: class I SAM-dependent methyltransferase [Spirochaetes bacterium]|jgi:ubiquinone/menaquinone biosynthesis C-methylase UbiE|nr:class I SAM-dependent methyltransferase [Spirochaetota bacterium]